MCMMLTMIQGKRKDNNTQLHMRFYTDSYKTKSLCTLCMIHVGTDDKTINMDRVLETKRKNVDWLF